MKILGSVNTEVFVTYLLDVLLPHLWVGAIVVMDNLSVRHAQRVRQVIESVGAKLVFLPPYSHVPTNLEGSSPFVSCRKGSARRSRSCFKSARNALNFHRFIAIGFGLADKLTFWKAWSPDQASFL